MKFSFPLKDVIIDFTTVPAEVKDPLFKDEYFALNQNEFSMDIKGVARFYASGGDFISVVPYSEASQDTFELYLNGSVYGAILHQRKTMPLHGSCFRYRDRGVMICGDSGAGKSSLTASFCLGGAQFLTDDVTPLLFKEGVPYIWPLSERIKLWSDSLRQLDQEETGLHRIDPAMEKFYYPINKGTDNIIRLNLVYILVIKDAGDVEFEELTGPEKFTALRNEIYRPEYLNGMPENEPVYFGNLVDMCNSVSVIRVSRPPVIHINELMIMISEHITA